jgi:hypothetical protein
VYAIGNDFPRDITILDAVSNVYNEKKQPIDRKDGLYNHHATFFDLGMLKYHVAVSADCTF